jgi:hypothetical protein
MREGVFADVLKLKEVDGLVCLGCGGDPLDWDKGVREKLPPSCKDILGDAFIVKTTGGRTDIVFPFNGVQIDMGVLAVWRISFGECSWISDYVVNYASQHDIEPKQPVAAVAKLGPPRKSVTPRKFVAPKKSVGANTSVPPPPKKIKKDEDLALAKSFTSYQQNM